MTKKNDPISDQALLARIALKDERALSTLFDLYHVRIFKIMEQLRLPQEDIEEAIQDLYLKIWDRADLMQRIQNVQRYMYAAARNQAINQLKKNTTEVNRLGKMYDEMHSHKTTTVLPVLNQLLEEQELFALLEEEVSKLPPKQQDVLRAYQEEGLSNREIAAKVGRAVNTVSQQLSMARKKLKEALRIRLGVRIG